MAKLWYLDRTLDLNTDYRLDKRIAFIVRKVGTNVSDEITLYVDNKPCIPFHGDFAPINYTDENMLGMLDLGDFYFVIPPDTPFKWSSGSSGKVRILGELWMLEPNESLPSEYNARLKEQMWRGISYKKNSVSTSGTTWSADEDIVLITLEPGVLEKFVLDDIIMIKFSNANIDFGQIGVYFELDDVPLEYIYEQGAKFGIDVKAFPYPPNQTNGWYPFTLKNTPFTLTYGHKLKIIARNVSGSDISSADGTNPITIDILVKMKYEKQPYAGT